MSSVPRNIRSRVTPNVLDEMAQNERASGADFLHVENRYRTYTVEDFEARKKRLEACSKSEKENHSQKSQNFVRKLIASLEKKNEVCKADDEFLTKYYRRRDSFPANFDPYREEERRRPLTMIESQFERETPNSCAEYNRANRNDDRNEQHSSNDNGKCNNGKKLAFERERTGKSDARSVQRGSKDDDNARNCIEPDSRRNFYANGNIGRREINCSSSFHPNRARVNLENRLDDTNDCLSKGSNSDRKRSTLERIFVKSGGEENSRVKDGSSIKKIGRSRSFKEFIGSVMKFKKSESKDRARHYVSCEHLSEEPKGFWDKGNNYLSRTVSFQGMMFEESGEETLSQSAERRATIRPLYGGKRKERRVEVSARKKESRKLLFAVEDKADDLVKPSAIRDIAKQLSKYPNKSPVSDRYYQGRKLLIESNY